MLALAVALTSSCHLYSILSQRLVLDGHPKQVVVGLPRPAKVDGSNFVERGRYIMFLSYGGWAISVIGGDSKV